MIDSPNKNYWVSASSEGGTVSSKRVIALWTAIVFLAIVLFSVFILKSKVGPDISETYVGYLKFTQIVLTSFILLLLGIATVAQIMQLVGQIKGNAPTNQPNNQNDAGANNNGQ